MVQSYGIAHYGQETDALMKECPLSSNRKPTPNGNHWAKTDVSMPRVSQKNMSRSARGQSGKIASNPRSGHGPALVRVSATRQARRCVQHREYCNRAASGGGWRAAHHEEPARCIGDADGDSFQLCNNAKRLGRIGARDDQRDLCEIIPGTARKMDLHG